MSAPAGDEPVVSRRVAPAALERLLEVLAATHHEGKACAAAGIDRTTLWRMKRRDAAFAARVDAAMATGLPVRVHDAVVEEALEGTPILDDNGREIGRKRNTRLLERLAEAHGILPTAKPAVAVQINNGSTPVDPASMPALEAELRERLMPPVHTPATDAELRELAGDDS